MTSQEITSIVIKSFTYRVAAFLIHFLVNYNFTKNVNQSILMTLTTETIQFLIYLSFELCWYYIQPLSDETHNLHKKLRHAYSKC